MLNPSPDKYTKGAGHLTDRSYDLIDGTLTGINTGNGSIQDDTFEWDGFGNLRARKNRLNNEEKFTYDVLNRLLTATVGSTVRETRYFDNGNIKRKNQVWGTSSNLYEYDGSQPHAVTSAFGYSLGYDESGNVVSRSGNGETWAFRWNATDKPHWMGREKTEQATAGSAFRYGVDRMRTVHYEFDSFDKSAGSDPQDWKPGHYTKKKLYIGEGSMEYDYVNTAPDGQPASWRVERYRLYVPGGDGKAGAVEIDPLKVDDTAYDRQVYHYDHLGSITAITPHGSTSGYADDKEGRDSLYSYDAWGQRRDAGDWRGEADSQTANSHGGDDDWATRGYTGHEMLDKLGLIHMNGRIYDPLLGRMLSADAIVDGVLTVQGYNRYSYVKNNPLSLTDPSGYKSADEEQKLREEEEKRRTALQRERVERDFFGKSGADYVRGAGSDSKASTLASSAADQSASSSNTQATNAVALASPVQTINDQLNPEEAPEEEADQLAEGSARREEQGSFTLYAHNSKFIGHVGVKVGNTSWDFGRYEGTYDDSSSLDDGPNILVRTEGDPPSAKHGSFVSFRFPVSGAMESVLEKHFTGVFDSGLKVSPLGPLSENQRYMESDWGVLGPNCGTFTFSTLYDAFNSVPQDSPLYNEAQHWIDAVEIFDSTAPASVVRTMSILNAMYPDGAPNF